VFSIGAGSLFLVGKTWDRAVSKWEDTFFLRIGTKLTNRSPCLTPAVLGMGFVPGILSSSPVSSGPGVLAIAATSGTICGGAVELGSSSCGCYGL